MLEHLLAAAGAVSIAGLCAALIYGLRLTCRPQDSEPGDGFFD